MSIDVRNKQIITIQNTLCAQDSGFHFCTFSSCLLWRINQENHETRNTHCTRRGL